MPPDSLADHDLLIRIDTKLDVYMSDVVNLKDRVTVLERSADRLAGFILGSKIVWGALAFVAGSGVIAYLYSHL